MLAAAALTLTGCAGTVAGEAVRAPDAAVVAQLDTGDYDTAPTRELGTAGDDAFARGLLESQRIAEFVVGPWEVDEELTRPAVGAGNGVNQSIPSADILQQVVGEAPGVVEAGRNRGLIAGFSSWRGAADAATGARCSTPCCGSPIPRRPRRPRPRSPRPSTRRGTASPRGNPHRFPATPTRAR